jgi:hypothetical protein
MEVEKMTLKEKLDMIILLLENSYVEIELMADEVKDINEPLFRMMTENDSYLLKQLHSRLTKYKDAEEIVKRYKWALASRKIIKY